MRGTRYLPWFGLVGLLVLLFGRIAGFPLQDPDEGRYAAIPLAMLAQGDWLTPTLAGVPYFEKPPLFYWLIAASFEFFGASAFAARFVSALAALATVAMTYGFGRHVFGRRAALLAAGMLATAPLFFILSQAAVIDMLLTACFTATMLAFFLACEAEEKGRWIAVVCVAAALGLLAKGLVALVLPGAIALLLLALRRDLGTLRALVRPWPILLFLAVGAPWFVWMSIEHPVFPDYFFVQQHFHRFLDAGAHDLPHVEGRFFYIPVILGAALPWSLVPLLLVLQERGRGAFSILRRDLLVFLGVWALGVVGFFSMSSSKLAPYILPAFPPIALAVGAWLDAALDDDEAFDPLGRSLWLGVVGLGMVLAPVGLVASLFAESLAEGVGAGAQDLRIVGGGVLWGGLALLGGGLLWRRLAGAGRLLPVDAFLLLVLTLGATEVGAIGARAVAKSGIYAARVLNAEAGPDDRIVLYHQLSQSLLFYSPRRVVHVEDFGELAELVAMLPEQEREKWFWEDDERLLREWNSEKRVFLYIDQRRLDELQPRLGRPARHLAQNRRRVLVDNPVVPAGGFAHDGTRPAMQSD